MGWGGVSGWMGEGGEKGRATRIDVDLELIQLEDGNGMRLVD